MKEIPLVGKNGVGKFVLVDDDDYIKYKDSRIHCSNYGYPQLTINGKVHLLHRVVTNAQKGMEVDHINHNTYDCTKQNLRVCTKSQNQMNKVPRKKYKNVHKFYKCDTWNVNIRIDGKDVYRASFDSEEEASYAADWAMLKYHGEFANLNHKDFDYTNYEPKPRTATSSYPGIFYAKKEGTWRAYVLNNSKSISVGDFLTEEDAATARDIFILKNKIDASMCRPSREYDLNTQINTKKSLRKTSRYLCVSKDGNKWRVVIHLGLGQKAYTKHGFNTQEDAARHYDQYVKENCLNKRLNFPDDDS